MSKYAVFTLPFLLVGIVIVAPALNPQSAQGGILPDKQLSYVRVQTTELLSRNYLQLKNDSASKTPKAQIVHTLVTAYSSTPEQTDSTPFITASGSYVRTGIVAANFLPIGSQIRIPELFGTQIFTVEDRLAKNYNDRIDVWFPTKKAALDFGQKIGKVEILQVQ